MSPPFESLKEFFYPAPNQQIIRGRSGEAIDAADARVHLGEIPFVRLRDGLPERFLEGRARFSEAVAEAQKAAPPIALRLDPSIQTVTAGGESFILQPAQFALYWMMADRRIAARGGVHWSDRDIGKELLAYYCASRPDARDSSQAQASPSAPKKERAPTPANPQRPNQSHCWPKADV